MIIPDPLINKVADLLDIPFSKTEGYLQEFGVTHGENALQDMDAYLEWADKNQEKHSTKVQTIGHDLSGRSDKWMCPRTSGYDEILTK